MNEAARIALLRAHLASPDEASAGAFAGITIGIGDDAAVLAPPLAPLVWTVDAQVEGTHFRSHWLSWEDVGFRSFMAAASDLAAMGASPVAALSSLTLAPSFDDDALEAFARGQAAASRRVGAPVVGGNVTRAETTTITTTVLGQAPAPITRSGARAGDGIYVAGALGLAAAGLAALFAGDGSARGDVDPAAADVFAPCLAAWRRPEARLADGLALRGRATAAIDVSDGLSGDALHLAEASDVALVLDREALLAAGGAALARAAVALRRDVLDLILHGGEDYAVLATSPVALPGYARIGEVVTPSAGKSPPRLYLASASAPSAREVIEARGFDHFA